MDIGIENWNLQQLTQNSHIFKFIIQRVVKHIISTTLHYNSIMKIMWRKYNKVISNFIVFELILALLLRILSQTVLQQRKSKTLVFRFQLDTWKIQLKCIRINFLFEDLYILWIQWKQILNSRMSAVFNAVTYTQNK